MPDAIAEISKLERKPSRRVSLLYERIGELKGMKRLAIRDTIGSPLITEPEAIIRVLTSYNAVTSNDGNLYEERSWGQTLIPQLKEVGAHGIVKAIKRLIAFSDEYERLVEELEAEYEDLEFEEYTRRDKEIRDRRLKCESGAELEEDLDKLLWEYAVRNRDQILTDWKPPKKRAAKKKRAGS